jgi:hypothetical protein
VSGNALDASRRAGPVIYFQDDGVQEQISFGDFVA